MALLLIALLGLVPTAFSDSNPQLLYTQNVFLTPQVYTSCHDAWEDGFREPGIFPILFESAHRPSSWRFIFCNNSEAHSTTIILLRRTGGESFERSFREFEAGFGLAKTDYFLGLEHIHVLTRRGLNRLRISVRDATGDLRQIAYEFFKLKGPPDYAFGLSAPGEGTLPDDFWFHRNLPFRAPGNLDSRGDGSSCANATGTGFWFQKEGPCAFALLTGNFRPNRSMCHSRMPYPICNGLYWVDWTGYRTLEHVIMELY
ncbi:hypothetical protein QR680_005644 [Steinernema hermaphroditum]|uniref:Fibrinogen C-terminal domain-containing protein n=1 Tax=Steinernema hermaphroditum TaxID=289476 RepID=A0AA39HV08_9BILA|nr:hypothetical protein QR680_005644 [Steinernema hermaphroditum]